MAKERVTVWARVGTLDEIKKVAQAGREQWALLLEDHTPPRKLETGAERSAWRAATVEWRAQLRREGRVLDTIAAVLEFGALAELRRRGWADQECPKLPTEKLLPGRWPGTRDGGYGEHFATHVDSAVAEQVRRACYWNSRESMDALQRWRDRNPGKVYGGAALERYDELAAKVTPVGEMWRAGIRLALAHATPDPSKGVVGH